MMWGVHAIRRPGSSTTSVGTKHGESEVATRPDVSHGRRRPFASLGSFPLIALSQPNQPAPPNDSDATSRDPMTIPQTPSTPLLTAVTRRRRVDHYVRSLAREDVVSSHHPLSSPPASLDPWPVRGRRYMCSRLTAAGRRVRAKRAVILQPVPAPRPAPSPNLQTALSTRHFFHLNRPERRGA
ncbi:uncharacterized protein LY79DRAFT_332414 [Colletotrichum navitas]|uniref:Uncharacterized protein n=1 Tax=Colletotrichum navitas TaxID=681940 RepID=A0AAD8PTD3_9PEZI|nr:uncharacterized protein LY79DRAFT_332414 [Colletotrichum navitas]KAK1579882.1 hypothetical protein LY79DRAFT_332414 [Colletotrichum navitas]